MGDKVLNSIKAAIADLQDEIDDMRVEEQGGYDNAHALRLASVLRTDLQKCLAWRRAASQEAI